jgi:tRNA(Arg) A34 adenosine deaminase TadA
MSMLEAMKIALEQAWEAFRNGSFPVGAALTDPSGNIVAVGRNRMGEGSAPDGRMRATGLAHAEMDVLAQLPLGDYVGHTLFTTLEPCLLCRSAATMTHVGTVEYLAADSLCEGLDALPSINAHASRRYPSMRGPSESRESDFASILPMAVFLLFNRDGDTAGHYAKSDRLRFATATRIVAEDAWPSKSLTLDAAIDHISTLHATVTGAK